MGSWVEDSMGVFFIYHNLLRMCFHFGSSVNHKEFLLEFDYISRAAALRPHN